MTITTKTIDYYDQETLLEGFFAYDDASDKRRPALLIAHAWGGRNAFVCDKARALAELGYAAFALDMYGKGVLGNGAEENSRLMQPFIDDRVLLQRRITAALTTVGTLEQVDSSRIAAIGFCFGGLCVLDLARSGADINGVVSFHGLLDPPDSGTGETINAKVLILHGHDDPMVPAESVAAIEQELTAAGVDWQLHSYGHTMHAFTNPEANDPGFGTVYQADADRRSWQTMQLFLAEILA